MQCWPSTQKPSNIFSKTRNWSFETHRRAYHLIQDEVRSKRLRVRRVTSEENLAARHDGVQQSNYLDGLHHFGGYVNMDEEKVGDDQQDVAMFWDFGCPVIRNGWQDRLLAEHSR